MHILSFPPGLVVLLHQQSGVIGWSGLLETGRLRGRVVQGRVLRVDQPTKQRTCAAGGKSFANDDGLQRHAGWAAPSGPRGLARNAVAGYCYFQRWPLRVTSRLKLRVQGPISFCQ